MKTINATLLANQKIPNGRGFASASLADSGRLHPTATGAGAGSYNGGATIGVECGTFYARVRYTGGGSNKLEYQKISDPTNTGQWTTWNSLVASDANGPTELAIFWTGSHVVVVYQLISTGDLKYKRSADGASWSGAGTVRTPLAANCNLAGVSGTSPKCGLMEAYQSQIYWQQYTDASDTWAAAESAGAAFSTTTPEIAAFQDTINGRYVVAVAVSGYVGWAVYTITAYTRATGSATWSTGQVLFSGNGLTGTFLGLQFCQRQIGGYWWLSFYRVRLWNVGSAANFQVCASNDGLFFDDPLPTPIQGNEYSLTILPAPSGGAWANAYYSTERAIYRLDRYTYWSNATVVSYGLITGRGGHQEGGSANGKGGVSPTIPTTASTLTILLDNRAGALASAPHLFSVLTLTRGLIINGTKYGQSAGAWYVVGFHYLNADGLLQITATDARGLLSNWFADTAYTYRGATVKFLVEWICALAGVHTVTFDATASWTETVNAFTHPVGENAIFALRSLAERIPFEYVPQEDGSLYFYVPTAGPGAVYTYGPGVNEHAAWLTAPARGSAAAPPLPPAVTNPPAWALSSGSQPAPPWFGETESVTYLQDIGSPPRNRVGEAIDQSALGQRGRRRTLIVNDRRLTTDGNTTEAANAILVAAQERKREGLFEAPPSFALEPGDVVAFSGSTYPATAGPWRVEQFEEHFNQTGSLGSAARPFYQRISLRGTA